MGTLADPAWGPLLPRKGQSPQGPAGELCRQSLATQAALGDSKAHLPDPTFPLNYLLL